MAECTTAYWCQCCPDCVPGGDSFVECVYCAEDTSYVPSITTTPQFTEVEIWHYHEDAFSWIPGLDCADASCGATNSLEDRHTLTGHYEDPGGAGCWYENYGGVPGDPYPYWHLAFGYGPDRWWFDIDFFRWDGDMGGDQIHFEKLYSEAGLTSPTWCYNGEGTGSVVFDNSHIVDTYHSTYCECLAMMDLPQETFEIEVFTYQPLIPFMPLMVKPKRKGVLGVDRKKVVQHLLRSNPKAMANLLKRR